MNRVLITGLPRSGTKYVATLLTKAGIPCGHESVFHEHGGDGSNWLIAPCVECSWMGAPATGDYAAHVIVVSRQPLLVWDSIRRCGLFSKPNAFQDFAVRHVPAIANAESIEQKIVVFMEEWSRLIKRSLLTIPVERFDLEHIALVAGLAGLPFKVSQALAALVATPKDINHR